MSTLLETAKRALSYLSEEELIEVNSYIDELLKNKQKEISSSIPPLENPIHVTIDLTGK